MTTSIGVVFGPMDESTIGILSYLITCQNALQQSFEFRIISCPEDDPFLESLSATPAPAHDEIVPGFVDLLTRVTAWNRQIAKSYDLEVISFDKVVLLTDVRFSDNYFYISSDTWAVIALGGWQSEFAPPSIVEYYLSFIVVLALDNVVQMGLSRHYETTGCVLDFSASLHHARGQQ